MQQRIYLSIMVIVSYLISIPTLAQSESSPITVNNVEQLTQIHSFGGECAAFSPDETVIATTTGLYDLDSGAARMDRADDPIERPTGISFSPDGNFLAVMTGHEGSLYDARTGEEIIHIPYSGVWMAFSDNGQLAYVHGLLYDTETWEELDFEAVPDFEFFSEGHTVWRKFTSGNGIQTYLSEGANYWVHPMEGIYNVHTGKLLDLPEALNDPHVLESSIFSPDDLLFFTGGDGIEEYIAYTVPDFERAYELSFDIGHMGVYYVEFSPNNLYFALYNDGVYQTSTGERLFEIAGYPTFSPDSGWVIAGNSRYQLPAGRLVQEFSSVPWMVEFSENDELLAVIPDGVFDLLTDEKRFDIDESVRDVSFNDDNTLLFASTNIPELWIYDTETGDVLQKLSGAQPLLSENEYFIALTVPNNGCVVYAIAD